jgi:uncharacterized protein with GYD domain
MTKLVILAKFQADAVALHVNNHGKTLQVAAQWATDNRITVTEMAFTTGAFDLVVILEGEDQAAMMGLIAAINAVAKCTTQTLTAIGDIDRVLEGANDAYSKMGETIG